MNRQSLGIRLGTVLLLLVPMFSGSLWAEGAAKGPEASELTTTLQSQAASDSEDRLRVRVGKSLVINSPEPLVRVSVTDPAIASAIIISETQVLIHGKAPGSVTLLLWNQNEQARSFDLQVELDVMGLREMFGRVMPEEQIQVRQTGAALVLTGTVSSEAALEQAEALGKTQTDRVVNMISLGERNEVVLLQVKIAEVNRAAFQDLGLNLFSTGATNTIGAITTQQFAQTIGSFGAIPANVDGGPNPATPSAVAGGIGNPTTGMPSIFGLSDLLNIFVFRPDLNLGFTVRALQQQNLLQILAEPNVMALNGREASFLAGGEFPFPVVQGGSNFTAVTIEFREFGVRLKFQPELIDENRVRLKVLPEVSALDFSNALTVSGFLVPAISTRRAETEVELGLGQSFAIAGLIDNRLIEVASKIPVLGDIPFFGKLFRSRAMNKNNTELLVMVTPQLVQPMDPGQLPPLPENPKPFLDTDKFDKDRGKKGDGAEE